MVMNLDASMLVKHDPFYFAMEHSWQLEPGAMVSNTIAAFATCPDIDGAQGTIAVASWAFKGLGGYAHEFGPIGFEEEFLWRLRRLGPTANISDNLSVGRDMPNPGSTRVERKDFILRHAESRFTRHAELLADMFAKSSRESSSAGAPKSIRAMETVSFRVCKLGASEMDDTWSAVLPKYKYNVSYCHF